MAISKERLEELIKDGGTIFYLSGKTIEKKVLKHKYFEYFINEKTQHLVEWQKEFGLGMWEHKLSKLFETEEDAKWHKEFKRIPRTDYLDLPTWEEFKYSDGFSFTSKDGRKIAIYNFSYIPTIHISDEWFMDEDFEYTKDGYIKACQKARELFLGETE